MTPISRPQPKIEMQNVAKAFGDNQVLLDVSLSVTTQESLAIIGTSGCGNLHGKEYFDACSQRRGVMTKGAGIVSNALDLQVWLRAAPYTSAKLTALKLLAVYIFPLRLPAHYKTYAALAALGYLLLLACRLLDVELYQPIAARQ